MLHLISLQCSIQKHTRMPWICSKSYYVHKHIKSVKNICQNQYGQTSPLSIISPFIEKAIFEISYCRKRLRNAMSESCNSLHIYSDKPYASLPSDGMKDGDAKRSCLDLLVVHFANSAVIRLDRRINMGQRYSKLTTTDGGASNNLYNIDLNKFAEAQA